MFIFKPDLTLYLCLDINVFLAILTLITYVINFKYYNNNNELSLGDQ